MAVKHVVTDGIGFTVPSYLLTEGIGNFSAGGGGGGSGADRFTPGLVFGPDGQRIKRPAAVER